VSKLGGEAAESGISKIDAARRQLDTAIELWFKDGDGLSAFTLAYASFKLLGNLYTHQGTDGFGQAIEQLTKQKGANKSMARMEITGENPELEAKLNDTAVAEKLTETAGALPGNKVLLDLETNYERIPPEKRDATIREVTDFLLTHMASRRQQLFVNCWHLGNHESEAMWRIYCGREDGVAIVLPYSRLRDSTSEANTFIGKVDYIPYEAEMLTSDWGNFSLAIHKRKEFEYEHEARIVGHRIAAAGTLDTSIEMGWDPEQHLDRIVISPYSRPWYADIAKGLVERLAPGLSGKVVSSSMSQPPFIPKQPEMSAEWIACAKELGYGVLAPDEVSS
jgi:hypothetical protein